MFGKHHPALKRKNSYVSFQVCCQSIVCFRFNSNTGSFSKAGFSQEAVNHLFFGLFCCFLNFFLFPIAQEYHNNWEPALNGQKKWKTSGKLLKITNLQTPDWIQPNRMTLALYEGVSIEDLFLNYFQSTIDSFDLLYCTFRIIQYNTSNRPDPNKELLHSRVLSIWFISHSIHNVCIMELWSIKMSAFVCFTFGSTDPGRSVRSRCVPADPHPLHCWCCYPENI